MANTRSRKKKGSASGRKARINADKIRNLRVAEIREVCGCTNSYASRIRDGQRFPTPKYGILLASYVGISLEELYESLRVIDTMREIME